MRFGTMDWWISPMCGERSSGGVMTCAGVTAWRKRDPKFEILILARPNLEVEACITHWNENEIFALNRWDDGKSAKHDGHWKDADIASIVFCYGWTTMSMEHVDFLLRRKRAYDYIFGDLVYDLIPPVWTLREIDKCVHHDFDPTQQNKNYHDNKTDISTTEVLEDDKPCSECAKGRIPTSCTQPHTLTWIWWHAPAYNADILPIKSEQQLADRFAAETFAEMREPLMVW